MFTDLLRQGLKMVNDILVWLALLVVVLVATSFSLYVLHAASGVTFTDSLKECTPEASPFADSSYSLKMLMEGSLMGDPYFTCISNGIAPISGEAVLPARRTRRAAAALTNATRRICAPRIHLARHERHGTVAFDRRPEI